MTRRRWLAVGALVTVAATWLYAHEGHVALPSRGARIDAEKGHLYLTREAREALGVEAVEVQRRPLPASFLVTARLVAPWGRHAFAASRLAGRVVKVHARAGQRVEAGQLLAEVASLELEALQQELLGARNDVALARKVLAGLEGTASVAEQTILDARTALRQQESALAVGRAKWRALGLDADALEALLRDGKGQPLTLPVRALVGGTVIHADLNVGKVVEPGEHLFEVVDLSAVWVRLGVLEKDLGRVRVGQPVELRLTAYPERAITVQVTVKGVSLEPTTHLGVAWAELENPTGEEPRWLPEMTGQARLLVETNEKTWTVPASALIEDGVESYVLVEEAKTAESSEFRRKPVAVVRRTPAWVEVLAGDLFAGDRVATTGAHELGGFFVPGVLKLSPQATRTLGVEVAPVGRAAVEGVVEIEGHVELPPEARSAASPQLGGSVVRLHVDRGQAVVPGQVLAEVSSLEFQTLQLEYLREHLTADLLGQQERRLRELGAIVPPKKLLDLEAAATAARNRRDGLRRRLEVVGLTAAQVNGLAERREVVEALPVRAAIAGRVAEFDRVVGQSVKADEALVQVHDPGKPLVVGYVGERNHGRVRVGQAARVRVVGESRVYEGKVVRSGRVFGREDQTLSVWVRLDGAGALLHNQLATLSLTVDAGATVVAVPRAAVAREGAQAVVFVRAEDGVFERRAVRLGRVDDRWAEVLDGVRETERIAIAGVAGLQTGYASVR